MTKWSTFRDLEHYARVAHLLLPSAFPPNPGRILGHLGFLPSLMNTNTLTSREGELTICCPLPSDLRRMWIQVQKGWSWTHTPWHFRIGQGSDSLCPGLKGAQNICRSLGKGLSPTFKPGTKYISEQRLQSIGSKLSTMDWDKGL